MFNLTLFVVIVSSVFVVERIWNAVLWWRPRKIESIFKKQGIKGPPRSWFGGNLVEQYTLRIARRNRGMPEGVSHDLVPHLTPDVALWSSLHGKPYVMWWIREPRIVFFEPECVREVLSKQAHCFEKSPTQLEFVIDFIGHGLVGVNGSEWVQHRTLVAPAFHAQKLKGMVSCMQQCAEKLVTKWKALASDGEVEIDITEDITKLAADVISHTAFGSNYEKGQKVFEGITDLGELVIKAYHYSWLPFFRWHPTNVNRKLWRVRREIDDILLGLIQERRKSGSLGNDLLGLLLKESENNNAFKDSILVDECKTFYLAGHETTSNLLGWALLLLALNPEWQERARAEAKEHCVNGFGPDGEAISKLKVVGMVLNETLRLYPVVTEVLRAATQDTVVNGINIPKGTGVVLAVLSLHHDPELWGEDANEFNPQRFEQGVAKACKHPNAFMPFIFGPRVCIGQTFAWMEARLVMALLLCNFSFKVSTNYKHNPTTKIVVLPEHGIQLMVEAL